MPPSQYQFISVVLFLLILFTSCSTPPDAQTVINKAIEKHGGSDYENSHIAFTFRGTRYIAKTQGDDFEYQRKLRDSSGVLIDQLNNNGFKRIINDRAVGLAAQESSAYSNSLNSVIYFAMLPYKLNDAAVNKKYLGTTTVKNEPYHEIQVSFDPEGGGTDYEDKFIYWIHQQDYTVDYLAYRFHVNNGGVRFRAANNIRTVKGIRFADYNNFKGPDDEAPLESYSELFSEGNLEQVSEINLQDIEIKLLD